MPQSGIVKYHVKLSYNVDGLVERADLIGAIFGQTEGLLGPEMNLNELQRVSKIGRIEVNTRTTSNTTSGDVLLPMSTDIDTSALIAAAIESIDKVGPFDCSFKLDAIDDVRAAKKEDIVKRAKEIRRKWATKTISEGDTMLKDVHEVAAGKLQTYGKSRLTCSSDIDTSPWIILVEGRADVINLLRAGYSNAIAIEGARIDESIKDLCKSKDTVVAFMDGDRSGGFILRELKSLVRVDYELRADPGIEVEEMTPQRVSEILDPVAEEIKGGRAQQGTGPSLAQGQDQPPPRRRDRDWRDRDRDRDRDRGRDRDRDWRDRDRDRGRDRDRDWRDRDRDRGRDRDRDWRDRDRDRGRDRDRDRGRDRDRDWRDHDRDSDRDRERPPQERPPPPPQPEPRQDAAPEDEALAGIARPVYESINESLEAVALDDAGREVFRVPISELVAKMSGQSGIKHLVLDGIITQRLLDASKTAGVGCVVGHRIARLTNPGGIDLKTFNELGIS